MRLAVIPARGGSKRIPRKNIREFCGMPMIARSIQAAFDSKCFDRVIVSTDDDEIAQIARQYGAEVPFIRPAELSDDHSPTRPVIAHAIQSVEHGQKVDWVCCIYATAPFVRAEDLRTGLERVQQDDCSYVFPVASYAFPIQRALKIDKKTGHVSMFYPEQFQTRSQDLEEAWHDAGQFYWASADQWKKDEPIFNDHAIALTIPRHRVQDIDTPEDWRLAELLFKAQENAQ